MAIIPLIDPGVPLAATQLQIYALPGAIAHITSSHPLEFSNSTTNATSSTQFQANTLSTTGMFTSSLYVRCTNSTVCIISVKKF